MTSKPSPFRSYQGHESKFWQGHHAKYKNSILAVGRGNASPDVNEREYAQAGQQFRDLVRRYVSDPGNSSVLDLGYGQGHYARACHELGFRRYLGLDFASPHKPSIPGFEFRTSDISRPIPGNEKFDLVICIDVIFHLVDDRCFQAAIKNIADHVRRPDGIILITSLFRDKDIAPYVRHRALSAYAGLGAAQVEGPSKWRDNSIVCWRALP